TELALQARAAGLQEDGQVRASLDLLDSARRKLGRGAAREASLDLVRDSSVVMGRSASGMFHLGRGDQDPSGVFTSPSPMLGLRRVTASVAAQLPEAPSVDDLSDLDLSALLGLKRNGAKN